MSPLLFGSQLRTKVDKNTKILNIFMTSLY